MVPTIPWEEAAVAKFADATGIDVTRTSGPVSATDRLAQYQQLMAAQASDVDAMMIDVIWPGIFATHAVDLSQAIGWQGQKYIDRIVQNNTVNGALVGIPWYTDAGLLYYRTDLLAKYGLENPPETWADLEKMAKTIQDGERASNPDFQGFVWQGAAYEGLTCDGLEWQYSSGGGDIIDKDAKVTVNNPQAIAAFERAKGWIGTISPQGVTTYMEEEARGVWQAGNAAFMRNWPYAYAPGQDPGSAIRDKFDVTLVPMGDGEGATHAANARRLADLRLQVLAEPTRSHRLRAVPHLQGGPEVVRGRAEPAAHHRRSVRRCRRAEGQSLLRPSEGHLSRRVGGAALDRDQRPLQPGLHGLLHCGQRDPDRSGGGCRGPRRRAGDAVEGIVAQL